MNLVTEPWIPVLHSSGERRLVSLHQVFAEGHDYIDLAVRPHERVALMRLLIAIAQAALDGPKDIDEWDQVPDRLVASATNYLDRKNGAFELFDLEKPFLQIGGLSKPTSNSKAKNPKVGTPVTKLEFSLATGNNTTLFDHGANSTGPRHVLSSSLPLMLITFQCFSPGGLISQLNWAEHLTSKSSNHALCTPGSMLHTFVRHQTLSKTIHANLLTFEQIKAHWGEEGIGHPVWECMPESWSDASSIKNATTTYLGRLMPISRLICLNPDGAHMLLGNGLDYPSFDGDEIQAEPSATVVLSRDGNGRTLLGAGGKAAWRELSSLIVQRKKDAIGGALTLQNIPNDSSYDIWTGAFLTSKASIEDTVESVLHVPAIMQLDIGRGAYDDEVKFSESVSSRLGWAVETWRENADGGWKGRIESTKPQDRGKLKLRLKSIATRHYWTSVEKIRPLLLAHIESLGSSVQFIEETRNQWRKAVWASAFDAYRIACGQETPRQIRAYALGLKRLTGEKHRQGEQAGQVTETMEA